MDRRVIDVGNCAPDHAAIRRLIVSRFGAQVVATHAWDDTLAELRAHGADLVLVNRKLDRDYSDGIEVIRRLKNTPELAAVPVMLLTNYAEHQQAAVALGAELGFGKLQLEAPETLDKLAPLLA